MKINKIVGIVAGLGLACLSSMQANAQFTPDNEVRQINHVDDGTGVITDVVLAIHTPLDVGEAPVPLPFANAGSTFELWVDEEGVVGKTLVDTKYVGLYGPKAAFTVQVEDDWRGVVEDTVNGVNVEIDAYRTRADRLYSANVQVSELSSDPTKPQAAREVMAAYEGQNGNLTTHELTGVKYALGSGANPLVLDAVNDNAGFIGPNLTGFANDSQRLGVEYVTVNSFPDTVTGSWKVGNAVIKVWPRMKTLINQMDPNTGDQEPFDPDQEFENSVRDIFIHYKNVYPGSYAYVQIYPGPYVAGTSGWPIDITALDTFDSETPQDSEDEGGYQIEHATLDPYIQRWGSGEYTIEVINAGLPFTGILGMSSLETDSIGHVSFKITQGMKVRGNIGSK